MELRGTILQPWNWHSPKTDDQGKNLWQHLKGSSCNLRKTGFTAVWLPPCSLASNGEHDVGYGIKNWYKLNWKINNFINVY